MGKKELTRQIQLAIIALTRIPPSIVSALSFLLAGAHNESVAWLNSFLLCITFLATGNETEAAVCFAKLFEEATHFDQIEAIALELLDSIENWAGFGPGRKPMAAFPTLGTPPTCSTGSPRHKGICCTALTTLGAAVAATGFQYTSCTGHTVCMKCGIGTSTSTKPGRAGQPIFVPRRVKCGPSGCLGNQA